MPCDLGRDPLSWLICKYKLSSQAKLKKTGPISKDFPMVEGLVCKSGKTQGFLNKNARVEL
jgi:hypothetical protein